MPKDTKQKDAKKKKAKAAAKAPVYKLPKKLRQKQFSKKEMKTETVKSLKAKARVHNAKVKAYLTIKLSQRKEALFRDVKIMLDSKVPRARNQVIAEHKAKQTKKQSAAGSGAGREVIDLT